MDCRIMVFATIVTPRLHYICEELLQPTNCPILFTDSEEVFRTFEGVKINYSAEQIQEEEFHLPPATNLLFENDIKTQVVPVTGKGNEAILYPITGGSFPFDFFAASFFLISRYEEWIPHTPDKYGRFRHTESIAFKNGFLKVPLINIWEKQFQQALTRRYLNLNFPERKFEFIPTYDIDMAYSYLHKGWVRNAGGMVRSILKGDMPAIKERTAVLQGKSPDPFDAFEWLDALHKRLAVNPIYFFLLAQKKGIYDKNIPPTNTVMQNLIKRHAEKYTVGIHPSWQSGDNTTLLREEITLLESITGPVTDSRQHFLRLHIPGTYEHLLQNGIKQEFSMGYSGMNGFRASIASPFRWYHLGKEEATTLTIHPFCFMDATAYYYQKLTPEQAFEELKALYGIIRQVNGRMITIWHNTFLGTNQQTARWKKIYERWLNEVAGINAPRAVF